MPSSPSSTLFPYTTLFRSNFDCERTLDAEAAEWTVTLDTSIFRLNYIRVTACRTGFRSLIQPPRRILFTVPHSLQIKSISGSRSEEHTSELQSLTNLVCRLLRALRSFPTRRSSDLISTASVLSTQKPQSGPSHSTHRYSV